MQKITYNEGQGEGNVSYENAAVQQLRDMTEQYGARVLLQMSRYSTGESFVLHHLAFSRGLSNPSELIDKAGTSSARIAAVLRSLEKKGEITREADLDDRRKTLVTITEVGCQRAMRELEEMNTTLWEIFNKLGEKDTEEFIRILNRFFEICILSDVEAIVSDTEGALPTAEGANE